MAILYVTPRWSSGNPRMLLVLAREFESRRGEISNSFAKTSVGKQAQFDASRRGNTPDFFHQGDLTRPYRAAPLLVG